MIENGNFLRPEKTIQVRITLPEELFEGGSDEASVMEECLVQLLIDCPIKQERWVMVNMFEGVVDDTPEKENDEYSHLAINQAAFGGQIKPILGDAPLTTAPYNHNG